MKNLLLVTNGFPYGESEQSFLRTEFIELAKEFNITVLTQDNNKKLIYPFEDINFKIEKYSYYCPKGFIKKVSFYIKNCHIKKVLVKDIINSAHGVGVKVFLKRLKEILWSFSQANYKKEQLEKIINNNQTDIVYTYWCTNITIAALMLKEKNKNLKVVTRFHGYDLYNERVEECYWQPLRNYISNCADKLIFVCDMGKDYFISNWGVGNNQQLVSWLGCGAFERICHGIKKEELTIVSCSNVIALKRVGLIVSALTLIPEDIKVNWHHIGYGDKYDELLEKAKTLLINKKNIKWKLWGEIENDKIENTYKTICPDLFITTSSTEGAPISLQEAFAMGIPVVATSAGGIPEMVFDEKNGYLLNETPSPQEVASKIIEFNNLDGTKTKQLSDNAYKTWKEKFDSVKNANNLIKELEKLNNQEKT